MTTSEKLTAKLSDGTSGELVHTASMGKEKLYKFVTFKPSPPKEVWVNVNSNGRVDLAYGPDEIVPKIRGAIVHRYILAPESGKEPECVTCGKEMARICGSNKNYFCRYCVDPKPAREWWEVRTGTTFSSVYSAQHTYERAILAASLFDRGEYKIVHVREVVSDGK